MEKELLTLADLEAVSKINRRQLAYAAQSYGIEPTQRAGVVKLYSREDSERIVASARRVAERRCSNVG